MSCAAALSWAGNFCISFRGKMAVDLCPRGTDRNGGGCRVLTLKILFCTTNFVLQGSLSFCISNVRIFKVRIDVPLESCSLGSPWIVRHQPEVGRFFVQPWKIKAIWQTNHFVKRLLKQFIYPRSNFVLFKVLKLFIIVEEASTPGQAFWCCVVLTEETWVHSLGLKTRCSPISTCFLVLALSPAHKFQAERLNTFSHVLACFTDSKTRRSSSAFHTRELDFQVESQPRDSCIAGLRKPEKETEFFSEQGTAQKFRNMDKAQKLFD